MLHCNWLQHTATHCNTLQNIAIALMVLQLELLDICTIELSDMITHPFLSLPSIQDFAMSACSRATCSVLLTAILRCSMSQLFSMLLYVADVHWCARPEVKTKENVLQQCVCSKAQCVVVLCSVLQYIAVYCSVLQSAAECFQGKRQKFHFSLFRIFLIRHLVKNEFQYCVELIPKPRT